MSQLTLRIRGQSAMKRIQCNPQSTYSQLLQLISNEFNINNINDIKLSKTPLATPNYINIPLNTSLKTQNFHNGDVLYLSGEPTTNTHPVQSNAANSNSNTNTTQQSQPTSHKLTSRCQHGVGGACVNCASTPIGTTKLNGKCNHSSATTCIHCMSTDDSNDDKSAPAAWLCNHPDTVFCPKCIPESTGDIATTLQCTCGPGQMCARCAHVPPETKVDKIPYAKYLADRRSLCQFKHSSTTSCYNCAAPIFPSFTGKSNCPNHTRKWPEQVCLSCAPPNAVLRQQVYRHCDSISIDASILQPFYTTWLQNDMKKNNERAAILFGKYVDEPASTDGAIRAQVHALYEPPQSHIPFGVQFTSDKYEKVVHEIGSALGLVPVGWVIAKLPVNDVKYGGDVLMSGAEVKQAAKLQWLYKQPNLYSQFVSLIVEYNSSAVEPHAYQISDVGVALVHDNVLGDATDHNLLAVRTPRTKEMIATVVYKDRPLIPGESTSEFLPDELLVKVIVSAPKQKESILYSHNFPSNALHTQVLDTYIQSYLSDNSKLPLLQRLSDLNLLIALVQYIGKSTVLEICTYIKTNQSLTGELTKAINDALKSTGLIR